MYSLKPDKETVVEKVKIKSPGHNVPALVIFPKERKTGVPGILWIHGGGYFLGMKEIVYSSIVMNIVKKYGAVVISPGYRLAFYKPYPAAINDCYAALLYLKEHALELGVNPNQIMVGGESAGGGLCAALCMMARDKGEVNVAYQMPLYPMIDNLDTESSKNNHGKVWNTRRNHFGWWMYLRGDSKKFVSPYAAAARQTNYEKLPPAYTFVGDGEPFYQETLTFIDNLQKAGVEASVDVYHTNVHAFDKFREKEEYAIEAKKKFDEKFEYAMNHYYAVNTCSDEKNKE